MARILIVEDDPHTLRVLSVWLTRHGHEVGEACNGLAAADRVIAQPFDLIVTDVNMPGMDGLELVRWLRHERVSPVPVILLTSRCDQSVLGEEFGRLDVRLHPKPFSPSQLVMEIEKRLVTSKKRLDDPQRPDALVPATSPPAAESGDSCQPVETPRHD